MKKTNKNKASNYILYMNREILYKIFKIMCQDTRRQVLFNNSEFSSFGK